MISSNEGKPRLGARTYVSSSEFSTELYVRSRIKEGTERETSGSRQYDGAETWHSSVGFTSVAARMSRHAYGYDEAAREKTSRWNAAHVSLHKTLKA